ncbi:MAG: polysaccharide pyruvyl transferase family protein [Candidatus Methanosuratincola petrocarbonis]
MKSFIPNITLKLFTFYPDIDRQFYQKYGIEVISHELDSRHVLLSMIPYMPDLVTSFLPCGNSHNPQGNFFFQKFMAANAVIDFSGDALSDSLDSGWSTTGLLTDMLPIILGILSKKPVILYSQSIGPFRTRSYLFTRFLLNKVSSIVVREHSSYNYLKSMRLKPSIIFGSEIAFLLDPISHPSKVLENDEKHPLIGFSVSAFQGSLFPNYRSLMADLLKWIVTELDAQIIFIPNVYDITSDDRVEAKRICEIARVSKDKIALVEEKLTPEEVKGLIAKCDLFIGCRWHATIFALSSGIPTISIGHSWKYFSTMKRLGQREFACNLFTTTPSELISKTRKAWTDRERLRRELIAHIELEKDCAKNAVKFTVNLLRKQMV